MLTALLISGDLMMSSRFQAAGAGQSIPLATALGPAAAIDRLSQAPARLVILDLTAPGLDPAQLVPALRDLPTPPTRIVAFAPHVHEARLAAAEAAGCDLVMSRGQFVRQLDELLAGADA